MGWATLITMLIEIFGPILAEWLKKWLDDRLNKAAERLPAFESYGSEWAARDALFDEAISDLPRWAFARRGLLRRMKATAGDPNRDTAELRDLALAAARE